MDQPAGYHQVESSGICHQGHQATTTCENQGGQGVDKLFNFDETDAWHSKWGKGEAIPFDMDIDLRSINNIDKLQYIPREDAGNGTLLKGTILTVSTRKNGQLRYRLNGLRMAR